MAEPQWLPVGPRAGGMKQVGGKVGVVVAGSKGFGAAGGGRESPNPRGHALPSLQTKRLN